ncbi:MAG: GTPase HflX [Clostridia bacterium]|nr:GTPase HflX [Clostridia bacterium]MBR5977074.1 GTPase HflX [Clostridia bacterium]MBR6478945.1 GTPase HflX [Clostridia bacterium]
MYENEQNLRPERAILCSVDTGEFDAEVSIDELEELAHTAGAEVVAKVIQARPAPDAALFLGPGKLDEIKDLYQYQDIDVLIFDDELSPSQQRNIEKYTDFKVIDRTTLILDIFAQHAKSKEGKLQVELAQLQYMLPRLGGQGAELSRLGGGIGTRGPGETKLESDRRHIHRRIDAIKRDLKDVEKRRNFQRSRRKKDGVQTVVIVGYTNAGKSTLMNYLTQAGVLAENKLFATLDPKSQALTLPSGREVMLIDTVGLVRRLPHNLVEAFKSTLEETASADVILNVCDASDPCSAEHLKVTRDLLAELGAGDKPIVNVMNKCDLIYDLNDVPTIGNTVYISALRGNGINKLLEAVEDALPKDRERHTYLFPYDKLKEANLVREDGKVFSEEYVDSGLRIDVECSIKTVNKLKEFINENN